MHTDSQNELEPRPSVLDGAEERSRGSAGRCVSAKSIVVGSILAACHTCWIVYEDMALGHISTAYTAFMLLQSAVAILFLLVGINSLLKRIRFSWMFAPGEMMVVFSMVTIAGIISGYDLLQNLLITLMWPYRAGGSQEFYTELFQFVPRHFVPRDANVVKAFYTGSADFWRFFRPDVLRAWLVPMAFWAVFMFLLASTMLCLSSVLRRQWVEKEKLEFPIIELPLMMARSNTVGELFRSRLFLIGFLFTAALLSMNALSNLFSFLPAINLNVREVGSRLFVSAPLNGMNPMYVCWWPYAFGLCYLIPQEISFSSWFFYLAIRLTAAYGTAQGWRQPTSGFAAGQFPYYRQLAGGAWIGLFVLVMWNARGWFREVLRKVADGEETAEDRQEPMSFRMAVFGALVGFLALVGLAVVSGLRLHVALLFFTAYFLIMIVMTRIYAQVAVPIFELFFLNTATLVTDFTGTSMLTRQDATVMSHFYWFNRCYRQHPMGHEMEAMVFADKLGHHVRPVVKIIVLAIVIGVVVGMLTCLQLSYSRGAATAKVTHTQDCSGIEAWMTHGSWTDNPAPPQVRNLTAVFGSVGIVSSLALVRSVWFGFPLHPVGYAFACSYAMEYIWLIMLVTWLIKTMVIHFGGLKLYRQSLPLFFGIVVGDATAQVAWALISTALGMRISTYAGAW